MAHRRFSGIRGLKSSLPSPTRQQVATTVSTRDVPLQFQELDFSQGQSILQALTQRTQAALAQFGVSGTRLPIREPGADVPFPEPSTLFTGTTQGGFAGVRTQTALPTTFQEGQLVPFQSGGGREVPGDFSTSITNQPAIAPTGGDPFGISGEPRTAGKFSLGDINPVKIIKDVGGTALEGIKDVQTTITTGGLDLLTEQLTGEPIEETLADSEDFIREELADLDDFFQEDLPEAFGNLLDSLGFGDTGISEAQATAIAARDLSRKQQEIAGRFDRARSEIDFKRERSRLARQRRISEANVRQGAQGTGAAGGTSEIGAIQSIRGTEAAEQGFLSTARAAAVGAGTAIDVATSFENQATDLLTGIQQEQSNIASNQAIFQSGLGLLTQIAGAF